MSSLRLLLAPAACAVLLGALSSGCYMLRPSSGAGQTRFDGTRAPDAAAVVVPADYVVEVVATGLNFPVGVTFDDAGRPCVVESGYSYGEVFTEPRLLRIEPGRAPAVITAGSRGGPWTGVTFHNGRFFIADGDVLKGGRILSVDANGRTQVLVGELPSFGDHHTNGPVMGGDGWLYFTQGTATNAGVVGEDNFKFGWLKRRPDFHDVPARDITLSGENFETPDLLGGAAGRTVSTGAFLPFGTPSSAGQVIKGRVKSTGTILRVRPEGGEPEVVAWGLRNPFGLAWAPDGALYVTDNGHDDRGSRKVWGAPDVLWRIEPGAWYGWPDYVAGVPITDSQFHGPGNRPLRFLLAEHPTPVPQPVARFAVHSSADGFDFARERFGFAGEAFVAIFGDQAPDTGKILGPVGGKVVRADPRTGVITDFAVNRGPREGPASKVGVPGLERPVAARFNRAGDTLYIVDFGVLLMDKSGAKPQQHTGALWAIRRVR